MKLNKYIHKKLMEIGMTPSEEDIEEWIIDWYMDTFKEINMGDTAGTPRQPPMWLAGPRWYDRRKKIIEAAEAEAKSYEKDE